ncbi:50S ribosomal protein L11 methyltransferase [Pigmentiphaga aceris]|uniref:Ribosomal protein L11 methyltransferase n=1 Tax=Pigmentiphaga aceris TaxID=1940612 RepID=A0A5C0ASR5_9BURK|nr:50S ribosomal protein L11 methyltransferase [Pigmentiphaga aceris]QEI05065.1 50S ribosomal protein L11 methyltransferase [Pigmentiphaga aceris]
MRELVLDCPEALAESLSDALLDAGALSVSVEDADEGTQAEQPLFGEPGLEPDVQAWSRNRVVALIADGDDPAQLMDQASGALSLDAAPAWTLREVPDADWVRLTQSQFEPIAVDGRIWIVPTWHDVPGEARVASPAGVDGVVIRLDPGLAFGTGSHPTTHLCLSWLASNLQAGQRVLDYGCGSGILAIAARKLGAGPTVGIDIDPQAVQSAHDNAQANDVEIDAGLPDTHAGWRADVVVANILSNPLKVLAPMLCERVLPGGHLVLSGVLERQAEEVAAVYATWLNISVWQARDGWVCLHGQRPA